VSTTCSGDTFAKIRSKLIALFLDLHAFHLKDLQAG
jgi:hypothetical protein